MKIATLKNLASQLNAIDNPKNIIPLIEAVLSGEANTSHWVKYGNKVIRWIDSGMPAHNAPFNLFQMGNEKLPFLSFSTMPISTCEGAGACLSFCYSFKAWRYPAVFFKQLTAYIAEKFSQGAITYQLADMLKKKAFKGLTDIDFRLNVDGDLTEYSMVLWFDILRKNPMLKVYGYSKSLELFLNYKGDFPTNYLLNLSSGHKYDNALIDQIRELPIYRGDFLAIPMSKKYSASNGDMTTPNYRRDMIKAHGKKAFACPGRCGTCTPKGHACGSKAFKGIDIIIPIH